MKKVLLIDGTCDNGTMPSFPPSLPPSLCSYILIKQTTQGNNVLLPSFLPPSLPLFLPT